MLSLCEQIHSDPIGVDRPVREDQNFGGARDHINANAPKNLSLCLRDEAVTRTHNFVHSGQCGRAIGQRGDSLRTAHGKYLVDARQRRCCQHRGAYFTARRRRHHHNALHTGDFRGNRVHEYRRRIGRPATGHINTYAIQCRDTLPQQVAVLILILPTLGTLTFMERPNTIRCAPKRRYHVRVQVRQSLLDGIPADTERLSILYRSPIQIIGVSDQRGIPLLCYRRHNLRHGLRKLRIGLCRADQQASKCGLEVRLGHVQSANGLRCHH